MTDCYVCSYCSSIDMDSAAAGTLQGDSDNDGDNENEREEQVLCCLLCLLAIGSCEHAP